MKILGAYFSYNKNLEQDCENIVKIETILKLWPIRIMVFISLDVSKVLNLLLITKLHSNTFDFLYKIQKKFIWQGKKAKIKHSILYNVYEKRGMQNVDLRNKITSMQFSWVKRLFEDDVHDWEVIPLFLIGQYLGKNFKFDNNFDINNDILSKFQNSFFLSRHFHKMDK